MFKRFLDKIKLPRIHVTLPNFSFRLPEIKVPQITIPFKKVATVLGAINTAIPVSYTHLTLPTKA